MLSIISLHPSIKTRLSTRTGNLAIASFGISLIALGLCAFGIISDIPVIGYSIGSISILFIFDTIRYTFLFYKKSKSSAILGTSSTLNMTRVIKRKNNIRCLKEINGLSIAEIEKRARPGEITESGFLAPGESFHDVLLNDWEVVEKLGWTHINIAHHLGEIFVTGKWEAPRPYGSINKNFNGQDLIISFRQYRGYQQCFFGSELRWSEDCFVEHTLTKAKIIICEGTLNYIASYGFYEGGGESNPYRINPIHAISLITGENIEDLKEKLMRF